MLRAMHDRFGYGSGVFAWATLWLLTTSNCVHAEEFEYNRDIRPILADNCFSCHGPDSAGRKADLRLDQREAAIDAGAIVEGEPDDSELIARIDTDDPELVMPPHETKKSLSDEDRQKIRQWISAGAPYQPHWSLVRPEKIALPSIENKEWAKNEIDYFVLAKLEELGLTPATEAKPEALFRRLHLDITGLPPAPQDVTEFVRQFETNADATLSAWIDELMEKPGWGEHRARYWLDAARYGDTHGLHFDNYREIWHYRDWVIRAFNSNQPFDDFTIEQIAGDLIPDPTDDQLIATGFQRCNMTTNEGGTIDDENLANYAADRVQTLGWVFLGTTTNCCQCHDHKFDSFTMNDYYSLAAFFRNTTQRGKDGNKQDGDGPVIVVPSVEDQPRWRKLPEEIAAAKQRVSDHRSRARGDFKTWLAETKPETLDDKLPTDGLEVHVVFNEGSDHPIVNHCQPTSAPTATGDIKWQPDGKLGPAPTLSSRNTFDLGDLGGFEREEGFSVGGWIKAGSKDTSGAIIARMDEQAESRGWDLFQNNRKLAVHMVQAWPGNAIKVSTKQDVLEPGAWQHVFATTDGSGKPDGIRIYVDGVEQELKTEKNTLKSDAKIRADTPLRVGQRSNGHVFEGGAVQDVRIYGRELDLNEITTIMHRGPLRALLALPIEQQTQDRQDAVYEHYLATFDQRFVEDSRAIDALQTERQAIRGRSPVTHVQQERADSQPMAQILMRGEYDKPGDDVVAAPPAALHPMPAGAPENRMGLAQWLVDANNPLTARVTVNRFWQQVFGQGIVVTPEDFGVMGAVPSHPDLLDWLAVEFRESGWDVKRCFKLMLMSATYRQSAVTTAEKLEQDRDNGLLSRGPRFRMDAEMVRDYALTVSGLMSPKMFGPGTKPYQPSNIWDIVGLPGGNTRNYVQDQGENLYRRTIYNFWKRMAPPPNLESLNAPSREVCTVRRERTNTPLQALVTLNDPQFVEAARQLAQQSLVACPSDDAHAIDYIARRTLCRSMNAREQSIAIDHKQRLLNYYQSHPTDAKKLIEVGDSATDDSLNEAELAAWTMVCNQILNLDEVLNK